MEMNLPYSALYVYGVVDTKIHPVTANGVGDRGDAVMFVPYKDIYAIVSYTPFEEYDPTEENTIAHENVIQSLLQTGANVAPMRFCTILKTRHDVLELLRSGYLVFKKNLIKVKEKKEFDVKMFLYLQNVAPDTHDVVSHSQNIATELYERLSSITTEAVLSDQVTKEMILNASFLVKEDQKQAFLLAIADFDTQYTDTVKIRISGPTAPYNFVSMPTVKNQY